MEKFFNIGRQWANTRLLLGALVIFLAWGCAHSDDRQHHLEASPPESLGVLTTSTDQNEAQNDQDEFFEDEFPSKYSQVPDPLMPINRFMFQFNDKLYFYGLKPIAKGYRFVVPKPIRQGVNNFFYNVAGIGRMANCVLQGKFRAAGGELGRFFLNASVGLLGLGNPAANYPALNPEKEDFGQTLGAYGIGNGIYLVLPLFGPSTLRDSVGMVGDQILFNPIAYIKPAYISYGLRGVNITNRLSLHIGDYEALKDAALDPYLMFRSAYIQNRQYMIKR